MVSVYNALIEKRNSLLDDHVLKYKYRTVHNNYPFFSATD
jgi:hypothetical protein